MTIGIDARLELTDEGYYDLVIGDDGDIVTEDAFDTAFLVSLLTDQRADESEVPTARLRRGWIGNEITPGFEMGSKIWIYEQSRINRTSLNGISDAAKDALQWFVEEELALAVLQSEAVATRTGMTLSVRVERPNSEVEQRAFTLWENTGT